MPREPEIIILTWRGRQVGNLAAVAELLGITQSTLRSYWTQRPGDIRGVPRMDDPPPGPITYESGDWGDGSPTEVVLTHPTTGVMLFDMEAEAEWGARRRRRPAQIHPARVR